VVVQGGSGNGNGKDSFNKDRPRKNKSNSKDDDTVFTSVKDAPARLTVRLPADAKLFVNGVACPLADATRSFATPKLQAGRDYYYTLRAEITRDGRVQTQTRRVDVAAGQRVNVRFDFDAEVVSAGR
jgi:uncharacterized protein (TIGR03000 family)